MTTALIIGVVVVGAGAVALRARWSRTVDERHSVQVHQHTIETLRHMADNRERPRRSSSGPGAGSVARRSVPAAPRTRPMTASARPSPPPSRLGANGRLQPEVEPARRGGDHPRRHGAAPPEQGNGRATRGAAGRADEGRRRGLVFVDDCAGPPPEVPPSVQGRAPGSAERTAPAPWAAAVRMFATGPPPLVLGVAAVVVVVAVVLGVVLSGGSSAARGGAAHRPSSASHSHTTTPPASSTTAPVVATPLSETPDAASYQAPGASYRVVLDATGLCWVFATDSATGQVVWTGTLAAGQTRMLAATGTMTVRLGAASDVSASVDGTPVELPAEFRSPFTMTFEAA